MNEYKECCKTCLALMQDYICGQWVCRRCSEAYGEIVIPYDLDSKCKNYKQGGDQCEYDGID